MAIMVCFTVPSSFSTWFLQSVNFKEAFFQIAFFQGHAPAKQLPLR